MIRSSFALVAVVCAGWISSASAQIFYEPVQYQYQFAGQTFFYGGHNPRVFDFASAEIATRAYGSVTRSEHIVPRAAVYSDAIPFRDLADHAYTGYASLNATDARNEAYNNVPRYFRKGDLLNAAVMDRDGTLLVPAHARPTLDIKVVRPFGVGPAPVVPHGTILVIPKKWLEKPAMKNEPSVVSARQ